MTWKRLRALNPNSEFEESASSSFSSSSSAFGIPNFGIWVERRASHRGHGDELAQTKSEAWIQNPSEVQTRLG